MRLETRYVERGPKLVCEDCGTPLVTLREDKDVFEIGCPVCSDNAKEEE